MPESDTHDEQPVQERLLEAAMSCFLNDDYHRVTTRQIATLAGTNISMIRYYFGSKEGLYEEMIRATYNTLFDVLDSSMLSSTGGFTDYFGIYYKTMQANPRFPALILKVLALNQGPGKRFIYQLLERGRTKGRERIEQLQQNRQVEATLDPDIVRIAFVSLAMMPILLKGVFEEQMERELDSEFFESLAMFNGNLFAAGLIPREDRE